MKILHIITSLATGGAEKLMVDILPRLRDKGESVDLLVFNGRNTPFKRQLIEKGITVYELGHGSVYNPLLIFKLIPFLRRYDIIHTHNTAPQLFVAIGSVVCSAVLCTTEHTTSNRRRGWRWYAPIDRWMYSRYRKVICISDKTEENLRKSTKHFPTETVTIYNGIPIDIYSKAEPANDLELFLPGSVKIIMVAGFRYQKDHPSVIRAINMLPDHYHLFLIGDGERRAEYEALICELRLENRVHLLGIRSDVASLLKAANICIVSSHWEGFGLAAVEAMAAGKPLIATDIPGLAEVVRGAGILVPANSPESIAKEIIHLSEDNAFYERIVALGKERAQQFDISKMVDGYVQVYKSLYKNK